MDEVKRVKSSDSHTSQSFLHSGPLNILFQFKAPGGINICYDKNTFTENKYQQ